MASTTMRRRMLTTGQVAQQTGWTIAKVRALCESGRLPAVNTSTGKRPRWSIPEHSLEEFLTPAHQPAERKPSPTRARRRRIDEGLPQVF